jgi:hypothetical protein
MTGYDPQLVADHRDVGEVHLDGGVEMCLGAVHVLVGVRQLFEAPAPEVAVNAKLVARMSLARARRLGRGLARSPRGTEQQRGRGLLAAAAHVHPTRQPAAARDQRGGHAVG